MSIQNPETTPDSHGKSNKKQISATPSWRSARQSWHILANAIHTMKNIDDPEPSSKQLLLISFSTYPENFMKFVYPFFL